MKPWIISKTAILRKTGMHILQIWIEDFAAVSDVNVIRNERMGTAYGDQIIRGVAECIRASLRTGEQVYRILGDEYLLVNEIGGTVGF